MVYYIHFQSYYRSLIKYIIKKKSENIATIIKIINFRQMYLLIETNYITKMNFRKHLCLSKLLKYLYIMYTFETEKHV